MGRFFRMIFAIVTLYWIGTLTSTIAQTSEASSGIVAEASNGACHISVRGGPQAFHVEIDGLVPGEVFEAASTSDGETMNLQVTAKENGTYGALLIPLVYGKSSGWASYAVRSRNCRLSVKYPWHV